MRFTTRWSASFFGIDCQHSLARGCQDDLAERYLAKLLVFPKEPGNQAIDGRLRLGDIRGRSCWLLCPSRAQENRESLAQEEPSETGSFA